MKLEDKFFKAFFYPFFIGIIISIVIVFVILFHYSGNYLDKKSANDIIIMEKEYAKININSVNVLLSNTLLKVQVGLHEVLTLYDNIATKITDRSKSSIGKDIHNFVDVTIEESRKDYESMWFLDRDTLEATDKSSDLYQQISTFSQLTQSLYSVLFSMNDILLNIYMLFEGTNLIIGYPFKYFSNIKFYENDDNPSWCTDEKGNKINYYKFKCRDFYNDILTAKDSRFYSDENIQKDRRIFITVPYSQYSRSETEIVFTICIQFKDQISQKNAYICGDIEGTNLLDSFDNFNNKLNGYFGITSIGFNGAFYYPQASYSEIGKTMTEYIFRWDIDFYLEEKIDFFDIIQKKIIKNYYDKIDKKK